MLAMEGRGGEETGSEGLGDQRIAGELCRTVAIVTVTALEASPQHSMLLLTVTSADATTAP
jgi:hypothetical protein